MLRLRGKAKSSFIQCRKVLDFYNKQTPITPNKVTGVSGKVFFVADIGVYSQKVGSKPKPYANALAGERAA